MASSGDHGTKRGRVLSLETLEGRQLLSTMAGLSTDTAPPTLTAASVRTAGKNGSIVLKFSEPMDEAAIEDAGAYRVELMTARDYRLTSSPGDLKIQVSYPRTPLTVLRTSYDAATRSLTITTRERIRAGSYVEVSTTPGKGSPARDVAGNAVDANLDGEPDATLRVALPRGPGSVKLGVSSRR